MASTADTLNVLHESLSVGLDVEQVHHGHKRTKDLSNCDSKVLNVTGIRMGFTAAAGAAVIGCSAVMALPACTRTTAIGRTSSAPTPTIVADSLIASLDDVRRITGLDTLASPPDSEVHQPRHFNSDLPVACQSVFDQQTAFGAGWNQFATATYFADTYNGEGRTKVRGMADIGQAVAVYPDEPAVHTAFDRLVSQLAACSALHLPRYDFTMDRGDPSAVTLDNNGWTVIYRVKSSVLIDVTVLGLEKPRQAAGTILQTITDRIP